MRQRVTSLSANSTCVKIYELVECPFLKRKKKPVDFYRTDLNTTFYNGQTRSDIKTVAKISVENKRKKC